MTPKMLREKRKSWSRGAGTGFFVMLGASVGNEALGSPRLGPEYPTWALVLSAFGCVLMAVIYIVEERSSRR